MEQLLLDTDAGPLSVAAGLVWHPLLARGAARRREVQALAEAAGADLVLLRGDETPHVALARRAEGARVGQVAAAAVIADALEQEGLRSVLAALPLPQSPARLLYLAVRDGVILADGDSVASEPEVRQRLAEDRAYGGWDRVLCPSAWALPDTQGRSLESFFAGVQLRRPRRWRLRGLRLNFARLALAAGIVAATGMAAAWGWRSHQLQQARVREEAAQRQQAQQARDDDSRRAAARPRPPWPLLPQPVDFARACIEAYARTGGVAGNWKLDGAVCEAGLLTVRWSRGSDAAWVSHLLALRPQAVVAADGQSALVSTAAPAPLAAPATETLQPLSMLRLRYLDLASRYGMQVRLEPMPTSAPPQLPGQPGAPSLPPAWSETRVQASTVLAPVVAAALLQAPGLRLQRLVFGMDKDGVPQYQFTGVHYVQP